MAYLNKKIQDEKEQKEAAALNSAKRHQRSSSIII